MNPHNLSPEDLQALDQATTACQKITGRPYDEVRNSILSIGMAFQPPVPQSVEPDPIRIYRPGHHDGSGLWFFADSIFDDGGCLIETPPVFDRGSIIEIRGTAYLIDYDTDTAPIMQPRKASRAGSLDQLLAALHKTQGTNAYLALGGILAYAFAPETLIRYNAAPGIWIHGRRASGKTTLAQTLIALWGMGRNASYGTQTSAAMDIQVTKFSNIPICFDEFRQTASAEPNQLLRSCFNRTGKAKGRMDSTRVNMIHPTTTPIVCGELTPDSDTAYRYITVECTRPEPEDLRLLDDLFKLADQCRLIPFLFNAGRGKVAATFVRILADWMDDTTHLGNDRQRLVMGIAYSAFAAAIGGKHTTELKAHIVSSLSNSLTSVAPSDPAPSDPGSSKDSAIVPDSWSPLGFAKLFTSEAPPEPELPPLGHNLTYPKDAGEIIRLGENLHAVRRELASHFRNEARQTATERTEGDVSDAITSYRHLARHHNRPDHELFACLLAWSNLGYTGDALCNAVETSLAAAEVAEKSSEEDKESNPFQKALGAITRSDAAGNRYTAEEALRLIREIMPRATKPSAT